MSSLVTIALSRLLRTRESHTLNCTLKRVGAENCCCFIHQKSVKLNYHISTAEGMISSGSCKQMTVLMA